MNENTTSTGFLVVNVRTSNGALPLENALVQIFPYHEEENKIKSEVLYSLRSDRSGQCRKVALETKPKALSMEPGEEEPFLSYCVSVYKDGYYESQVYNLSVFDGITSLQNFDLIPLSEDADPDSVTPDYDARYPVIPNQSL